MMDGSSEFDDVRSGAPSPSQALRQAVGVVSTSRTGLDEVGALLAREGVGLSLSMAVEGSDMDHDGGSQGMLDGLATLQHDAATQAIILVSGLVAAGAARRVLAQVRSSEKPTVICFVGVDRHLAWRAGAIPASRMDEGSMRAAAWVRGWDQALISSRLEDLDEELQGRAHVLAARIGPERTRLVGLLTSGLFCHEAQLMLADCASPVAQATFHDLGAEGALGDQIHLARQALVDPDVALVLLDLHFDDGEVSRLREALATLPQHCREQAMVIAHVCGQVQPTEDDLDRLEDLEAGLRETGVILAPSNAAAARLAGMILAAT